MQIYVYTNTYKHIHIYIITLYIYIIYIIYIYIYIYILDKTNERGNMVNNFDMLHIIGRTNPHDIRNLKIERTTQRQGLGGTGIYQMEPFLFWGWFRGICSERLEEETFGNNTLN